MLVELTRHFSSFGVVVHHAALGPTEQAGSALVGVVHAGGKARHVGVR
jgi:hypothetical protein